MGSSDSFVHLHVHTEYSMLDGAARLKDLFAEVKSQGMTHVAMTDHGNMYGAAEFHRQAKDAGITPVIGIEAYVAPEARSNTVSLVLVCPSTLTQLNDASQLALSAVWRSAGATLASLSRKPSIVAMRGPIIAAPFASPSSVTSRPPTPPRRETTLGRVSVVRMACEAPSKRSRSPESPATARATPSRTFGMGS